VRGKGTAAVAALVRWLAAVQGIRRITGVTGTQEPASLRLLEPRGFRLTGRLQAPARCATH